MKIVTRSLATLAVLFLMAGLAPAQEKPIEIPKTKGAWMIVLHV